MPLMLTKDDLNETEADLIVDAHPRYRKKAAADMDGIGPFRRGNLLRRAPKAVLRIQGPEYRMDDVWQDEHLARCYRDCLDLAKAKGFESMAFPLISAGPVSDPALEALEIALDAILDWLDRNGDSLQVLLCLPREDLFLEGIRRVRKKRKQRDGNTEHCGHGREL